MIHHRCQLPDRNGLTTHWVCAECRWAWRLNAVVLHWFRYVPADPPP